MIIEEILPTDRVVKEFPMKIPNETVENLIKRLCPKYITVNIVTSENKEKEEND